jgi:dGTPase
MIGHVVTDLIEQSSMRIAELAPKTIDDVRAASEPMIGFSNSVFTHHSALKDFLRSNLYRHQQVRKMNEETQVIVETLFRIYLADISQIPATFEPRAGIDDGAGKARVVADYIAGMTDRFAIAEYERLS